MLPDESWSNRDHISATSSSDKLLIPVSWSPFGKVTMVQSRNHIESRKRNRKLIQQQKLLIQLLPFLNSWKLRQPEPSSSIRRNILPKPSIPTAPRDRHSNRNLSIGSFALGAWNVARSAILCSSPVCADTGRGMVTFSFSFSWRTLGHRPFWWFNWLVYCNRKSSFWRTQSRNLFSSIDIFTDWILVERERERE